MEKYSSTGGYGVDYGKDIILPAYKGYRPFELATISESPMDEQRMNTDACRVAHTQQPWYYGNHLKTYKMDYV